MRSRWIGKNVDLALVSGLLEDFLKAKNFKTRREKLAAGYKILATSQRAHDLCGDVEVSILGDANDFVIVLSGGERARSSILLGFITTLIGGGSLILRGLKSRETLEKLEKEFWEYVGGSISHLVNSAGR